MGAAGYALAGVSLIGTAVGVGAQLQAGAAAGGTAEFNARMMELEAKDTIDRGEQSVAEIEREGRMMVGEQRAVLAAQGIDINDGTAADLQASTVRTTLDTIARVRADAALQAWGLRTNARSVRRSGAYAQQGARLNALGMGLSGVAQAGSMAYTAYREGSGGSASGSRTAGAVSPAEASAASRSVWDYV